MINSINSGRATDRSAACTLFRDRLWRDFKLHLHTGWFSNTTAEAEFVLEARTFPLSLDTLHGVSKRSSLSSYAFVIEGEGEKKYHPILRNWKKCYLDGRRKKKMLDWKESFCCFDFKLLISHLYTTLNCTFSLCENSILISFSNFSFSEFLDYVGQENKFEQFSYISFGILFKRNLFLVRFDR